MDNREFLRAGSDEPKLEGFLPARGRCVTMAAFECLQSNGHVVYVS